MNLIKEWTFCICSTVIVSVIFSLLAPKGGSGRFYKSVISLFIFISFLFPFTQIGDKKLDFNLDNINIEAENNTNSIIVELVMITNEEKEKTKTYRMETIDKVGISEFIKNFNTAKFKITKMEYHEQTSKIKYIEISQQYE